jgi:hypothetical protein
MGSFSFKCKESNKAISDGDACRIYLLKDGKVLEEMRGHYDTFGRVEDGSFGSLEWNMPWRDICDLMFDDNDGNGLALVLEKYFKNKIPTTISEDDSSQGWGKSNGGNIQILEPIHIII